MYIAFIVTSFPTGGQPYILNQIAGLLDAGHDVDVLARTPAPDSLSHPDVDEYDLLACTTYFDDVTSRSKRLARGGKAVCRFLRLNPPMALRAINVFRYGRDALSLKLAVLAAKVYPRSYDVVHCHWGINGGLGSFLKNAGIARACVTEFHGYDATSALAGNPEKWRRLFADTDLCLVVCEYFKRKLISAGCPKERIRVHHTGLSLGRFGFCPRFPREDNTVELLSVGRLVAFKGFDIALQAVASLLRQKISLRYTIVGGGNRAVELKDECIRLGLEERVKFVPMCSQEELIEHYSRAGLFVHSSLRMTDGLTEGIPNAVKEAMACGIPVVATDAGGTIELVEDGITGLVCRAGDADALAVRIQDALKMGDDWAPVLRSARSRIEEQYNSEKLNARLLEHYDKLVSEATGDAQG